MGVRNGDRRASICARECAGKRAIMQCRRACWLLTERLIHVSLWVDLPCQRRLTNDDWSPTSSRRIYPSSRPYGGQMRLLMSATCDYWFSWISQGQKRLTMGAALAQRCAACASLTGGGAVLCVQQADEFEPDRMTGDHRSDLKISSAFLLYPIAI